MRKADAVAPRLDELQARSPRGREPQFALDLACIRRLRSELPARAELIHDPAQAIDEGPLQKLTVPGSSERRILRENVRERNFDRVTPEPSAREHTELLDRGLA